jgi:hypothetical protein
MVPRIRFDLDFTEDTPHYWDRFWDDNPILGKVNGDPDITSEVLRFYQKIIWNKELPNGEYLDLSFGSGSDYLTWNGMRFGSDSITASFRYRDNLNLISQVAGSMSDWHAFIEDYIRRSYTIGGEMIFPKRMHGINQSRGLNRMIRDRWDLTLECIRRYYDGCPSPLYDVLEKDTAFFDLFVDFKGYVDFFYLQDCVNSDYTSVIIWLDNDDFNKGPLPRSVDEYLLFIDKELRFVEMRNERIKKAVSSQYLI